jgi:hypothetical protein
LLLLPPLPLVLLGFGNPPLLPLLKLPLVVVVVLLLLLLVVVVVVEVPTVALCAANVLLVVVLRGLQLVSVLLPVPGCSCWLIFPGVKLLLLLLLLLGGGFTWGCSWLLL